MARFKVEFHFILDDDEVPGILNKFSSALQGAVFQTMELRDGKFTIMQPGVHAVDDTQTFGTVTKLPW